MAYMLPYIRRSILGRMGVDSKEVKVARLISTMAKNNLDWFCYRGHNRDHCTSSGSRKSV